MTAAFTASSRSPVSRMNRPSSCGSPLPTKAPSGRDARHPSAHLLARLLHEAGRHREALDAATHGLMAEPYSEPLQNLAVSATRALAGPDEARSLRQRYATALARLDPELA